MSNTKNESRRRQTGRESGDLSKGPGLNSLCQAILDAPVYDREDPPSHAALVAAYVALTELAQDLAEQVMGCGDARDAMEALASEKEGAR